MNNREFFDALLAASKVEHLEAALGKFLAENARAQFLPVGGRPNNRGAIEVVTDPGRSLIERVTNAHDALLEFEHEQHSGLPKCSSPREAAQAWLEVPERQGLSGLTNKQRRSLAERAAVYLEPGEGWQSRLLTVEDKGIGISTANLSKTILSLNESNKIQKHYLAGTYGQGGSSTFAFCKYVVIASRRSGNDTICFTVVKYEDLPAEEYKTGRYVYLTCDDLPLEIAASGGDISQGTIIKHFGYDLTKYTSSIGPRSLYGMFGRVLFDPVSSIWFVNNVHGWKRTIKGARNALNGAVDDGDEEGKGPALSHNVPMFNVSLGDHGTIGIEYWVLARPEPKADGTRTKTKPSDSFVDSAKPIILTHNGQNQGEISGRLIRDDADLPFLQTQGRLIVHVNCDRLSPNAKRSLFSSTREQSREGFMLSEISKEVVRALEADEDLARLNEEAREQSLKEKDEDAQKRMRKQVAKLLKLSGAAVAEEVGGSKQKGDGGKSSNVRGPRVKPEPITPCDPPTFIRIKWDDDKKIPFHAGQRRYLRVETDANSHYHNPDDPAKSHINIAVGDDLKVFGTSPLTGGRMRIGLECLQTVATGSTGTIRVELQLKGKPTLSDERDYDIVKLPEPKAPEKKSTLPDFEVIAVSGPDDDDWQYICDDPSDENPNRYASNAVMSSGKLHIYYSESYPRFATELRAFEKQSAAVAKSFQSRYETWIAVHALLMYQEQEENKVDGVDEQAEKEMFRQERARYATVAAMIASQEAKSGAIDQDDDSEAA